MAYRVLIVDDEAEGRASLSDLVGEWGYEVRTAGSGAEALRVAVGWHPDVVLTDLMMPRGDGLWLLKSLRIDVPDCPVVLLTGRGSIPLAVDAIREGAFDFIEKPADLSRLSVVLHRAVEKKETLREVDFLRRRLDAVAPGIDVIAASPAMERVLELVRRVAPSQSSVIISGESGAGKEVVARLIHQQSPRREGPFLALNCSAIPATLIESELFGYERGAFTGADQRRLGHFELAKGGTLFLDEIADMPPEIQVKLLRVLEERRIWRLGGKAEVEVDVRVLCATHRDLQEETRRGRFRQDLYFRLAVFAIALPPLRERREDVPLLVAHFVEKFNAETGKRVRGVSPGALALLQSHSWPGNVRELRNALERAMILADGEVIGESLLPPEISRPGAERAAISVPLGVPLDEVEREYLLASLERLGGNKARTAAALGISEKTLYNKLHRYAAEEEAREAREPASGT